MHAEATPPARPISPRRWAVPVAATLLVTALALLAACSTAPKAVAGADSRADLAGYTTFTFARPLATEAGGQPSALTQHMEQAALREMRSRGFRQTSNMPQLIINFNANTAQPMPTVPTPPRLVPAGYYAYRDGQYTVWPGYRDGNAASPYPPGTINIDVVDAASKQLVWEGVVPGAIQPGSPESLKASVDEAVKAAFAAYPKARAGSAM
jgi:hypothetical protein